MGAPVTDPAILEQLNGPSPPEPPSPHVRGVPVTDPAILEQLNRRELGIDFSRPIRDVRTAIARLPQADRQDALRQWADAYVAREREEARQPRGVLSTLAFGGDRQHLDDSVRAVARGTFVGPLLDEANALTSAGLHRLTGGAAGSPYDEALAYQRALDRAIDRDRPWEAGTLQVVGAVAPVAGAGRAVGTVLGGPQLTARTLPRNMALGATVVGPTAAYVHGFGNSEADTLEARHEAGMGAVPIGVVAGAAAPAVIRSGGAALTALRDYLSPRLAQTGAALRDIPRRLGIHASADGGGPAVAPGVGAAAEQMIANRLTSAGVRPDALRRTFGAEDVEGSMNYLRRFNEGSHAQDVLTLGDVHQSVQRLLGETSRRSTGAGEDISNVLYARQTGITPTGADAAELARRGFPTRASMARRDPRGVPAGQSERHIDAYRRALRLEDDVHHGHKRTGRLTEQDVLDQAARTADRFYRIAFRAARDTDMRPIIHPILARWEARLPSEAHEFRPELQRLIAMFRDSRSLQLFDRNKRRSLDDAIGEAQRTGDRYRLMRLTQLKDELLAAVDSAPGMSRYASARDSFGSRLEMRDHYRSGYQAMGEDAAIGVEAFRRIESEAGRKMFRLGTLARAADDVAKLPMGRDRLHYFDTQRRRELLSRIIPRTETEVQEKARGVFGDRPERFGGWLGHEASMVQTRNRAIGGSPTAERVGDDAAFKALSTVADVFHAQGLQAAGMRMAESALKAVFGMGQDRAETIARMLLTAEPRERARIIEAVVKRMGPSRAAQFADYMQQAQAQLTGATARGATGAIAGGP